MELFLGPETDVEAEVGPCIKRNAGELRRSTQMAF
jgi:hypothetical protein